MIPAVSTASMSYAIGNSIANLQRRLAAAQKELSTGTHADLGDAVGAEVGRAYSMRLSLQDMQTITATNNVVMTRLAVTQTALSALSSGAQKLLSTLISAQNDGGDPALIETQARTALGNLISTLNISDGASHVFSGVNSDAVPISNYFATPSPASKLALDAAFSSAFGMSQSDTGVSTITSAQMEAFLPGPMADLFSPANWQANWSNASSRPIQSRISVSQTIPTSVTANEPALQKLAMGYTMLSDLGLNKLNDAAYRAVIRTATQYLQEGISGLTRIQENVGVMQSDVTNANHIMAAQQNLLSTQIGALENVDPTETAAQINNLMTQIETSYALTAQIQRLSLVRYL